MTSTYTPTNNSGYQSPSAMASAPVAATKSATVSGAPAGFDIAPGSSISGNLQYGSSALPTTANVNPVITANALTPISPISLPTPPIGTNQNGTITGANTSLINPTKGVTYDGNGLVYTPPKDPGNQTDNFKSILDSYLGNQPTPPSAESLYNNLPEKQAYEAAQAEVQNYTAQINAITSKSQADQLSLIGQGRGVPEAIIGGQQAQISREAAIKALPLQALLANAQGNKQLAQEHLDTVFKLRMEDATNQYQYKTKVLDAVYNFADKQEQRRLDTLQHSEDQKFTLMRDEMNNANAFALKAVEYGQASLGAKLAGLDPKSPTYTKDVNTLASQLVKPPTKIGTQVVEVGGKKLLINSETGATIKEIGSEGVTTNDLKLAENQANIQEVTGLLTSGGLGASVGTSFLTRAPIGFWGSLGAITSVVGIPSFIGGTYKNLTGEKQNFIAGVEQVRSALNLDTLIKAKSQGATFGALSNQELQVLANTATKLGSWAIEKDGRTVGYNVSEKDFKAELDKINNFAKLDYILKGGTPESIGAVTQPDGTLWVQNSDGTYTKLR